MVSPNTDRPVPQNAKFTEQSENQNFENQNLGDSPDEILHRFTLKNVMRLAIGHLSINT